MSCTKFCWGENLHSKCASSIVDIIHEHEVGMNYFYVLFQYRKSILPFQFEENTSQFLHIFTTLTLQKIMPWITYQNLKKMFHMYNFHVCNVFHFNKYNTHSIFNMCHCMLDINGLLGKIILHANVHFSTIIR